MNPDSPKDEREIILIAFGPYPEPEMDGAGRDAYAAMMREFRRERRGLVDS
jgi:hypothetical protein